MNHTSFARLALLILILTTPHVVAMRMADALVLPKQLWVCAFAVMLLAGLILDRMGAWSKTRFAYLPLVRTPLDLPLLALVVSCVLSNLASPLVPVFWYALLAAYIWIFHLLAAQMAHDPRRMGVFMDAALAAAVLAAVHGLAQDFKWIEVHRIGGVNDWRADVIANIGNPNFLAMVLAYIAPYAVIRAVTASPPLARAAYVAALVPLSMCLVVTWSAGVWSAIVVLLAPALALGAWKLRDPAAGARFSLARLANGLAVVAVVAGAILFYVLPLPYNGRPGSIIDHALASPQWTGGMGARWFIWDTTKLMVADKPLLGIGFGNYLALHQKYQGEHYLLRGTPHDRPTVGLVNHCHNEYLQRLAETGLVGFAATLWLVGAALYGSARAWTLHDLRERRLASAAALGLWLAALHALVDMPAFLPASGLWLVLLAAVVAGAETRRRWSSFPRARPIAGGPARILLVGLAALLCLAWLGRLAVADMAVRAAREGAPPWLIRALDPLASLMADGVMRERATDRQLRYAGLAVRLDPTSHAAAADYGLLLLRRGETLTGLAHLRRACALVDRVELRRVMIDDAIDRDDAGTAIAELQALIALNPCWPDYHEELAAIYFEIGQLDKAAEHFRRAEELREQ